MPTEKAAATALTAGLSLLGLSLADLGLIMQIFAAFCGAVGSLAAAWYYIRKSK